MPDSVMTLFPYVLSSFEAMKMSLQAALTFHQVQMQWDYSAPSGFLKNTAARWPIF
jgi:hypothetical protein